jgi:hypothetical protein
MTASENRLPLQSHLLTHTRDKQFYLVFVDNVLMRQYIKHDTSKDRMHIECEAHWFAIFLFTNCDQVCNGVSLQV